MEDAARLMRAGDGARACRAAVAALWVAGLVGSATPSVVPAQEASDRLDAAADSVRWLVASAREAAGRDDHEAALRDATAAIARDPSQERVLDLLIAHQLTWSDRPAEAVPWYRRRLAHDPANAEARAGLARALSWTGDTRAALLEYESLLADEPGNADAALGVGRMHAWREEYGAAARAYAVAVAIDPASEEAQRGLADAENRRGYHRRAEAAYRTRLAADPEDGEARIGLARALAWMGEEEHALATLDGAEGADAADLRGAILDERAPDLDAAYSHWKDRDDQTLDTVALHAARGFGGGWRGVVEAARFVADEPGTPEVEGLRAAAGADWRVDRHVAIQGRLGVLGVGRNLRQDDVVPVGAGETREGRDVKSTWLLWDSWVTWNPADRIRVDLSHSRLPIETPRALGRGIRADLAGLGVDWRAADHLSLRAEGSVTEYTDGNRRTAGSGEAESGPWPIGPRVHGWLSAGGSMSRFDDSPDHGYYSPGTYDALFAAGRARVTFTERAWLEGDVRLGSEQENDEDRFGVVNGGVELRVGSASGYGASAFWRSSTSRLDSSAGYERDGFGVSLFRAR